MRVIAIATITLALQWPQPAHTPTTRPPLTGTPHCTRQPHTQHTDLAPHLTKAIQALAPTGINTTTGPNINIGYGPTPAGTYATASRDTITINPTKWQHLTDQLRTTLLVHELAHTYGANHTPDPASVMHPHITTPKPVTPDLVAFLAPCRHR